MDTNEINIKWVSMKISSTHEKVKQHYPSILIQILTKIIWNFCFNLVKNEYFQFLVKDVRLSQTSSSFSNDSQLLHFRAG